MRFLTLSRTAGCDANAPHAATADVRTFWTIMTVVESILWTLSFVVSCYTWSLVYRVQRDGPAALGVRDPPEYPSDEFDWQWTVRHGQLTQANEKC